MAPEIKPEGVELSLRAELPFLALPLLGVIDLVKTDHCSVDYKTIAATPDLKLETWLPRTQALHALMDDFVGIAGRN